MNIPYTSDNKKINGKAIGSLFLGTISIVGILFIGQGGVISIAGLLLGIIGIREKLKELSRLVEV